MAETADDSNDTAREKVVSKGLAKRKYLLEDKDLEGLEFKLKDNPVNKSYGKHVVIFVPEQVCAGTYGWKERAVVNILYFMFSTLFSSSHENI